jgi:hypothetical protein
MRSKASSQTRLLTIAELPLPLYRLAQRPPPAEICTIFLARRARPMMRRFRASIVVSGTVFFAVLLLIVVQAAMQHLGR